MLQVWPWLTYKEVVWAWKVAANMFSALHRVFPCRFAGCGGPLSLCSHSISETCVFHHVVVKMKFLPRTERPEGESTSRGCALV